MVAITRCSYLGSQFRNALIKKDGSVLWQINSNEFYSQLSLFTKQSSPSAFAILFTDKDGRLSCLVSGLGRLHMQNNEDSENKMINIVLVEESAEDRHSIVAFFNSFRDNFFEYQREILDCMTCVCGNEKESYSFDTNKLFGCIENCKGVGVYKGACKLMENKIIAYFTPVDKSECNISWLIRDFASIDLSLSKGDMYFSHFKEKSLKHKASLFMLKSKILKAFK